jgi:flagellar protein FlaG
MTTISPAFTPSFANSTTSNAAERNPGGNGLLEPRSDNSFRQQVANENVSLTATEVEETVESLNNAMQMLRRGLNFRIDHDNGRTIIKVIDTATDDVIKQIPSEDSVTLINHMQEMESLLFDEQV